MSKSNITTDAKERKGLPVFSGVLKYFPDALLAVAECSRIGNDQHNAGKPLHWDRSKSGDELDALTRQRPSRCIFQVWHKTSQAKISLE